MAIWNVIRGSVGAIARFVVVFHTSPSWDVAKHLEGEHLAQQIVMAVASVLLGSLLSLRLLVPPVKFGVDLGADAASLDSTPESRRSTTESRCSIPES